jgi:hypothetical protein
LEQARLQRGDERIEVAIVGSTSEMGRNEVVVFSWPSYAILERVEAGKMKVARRQFREMVLARVEDGFTLVEEPWVTPAATPSVDTLRTEERLVDASEIRDVVPPLFHEVVDLFEADEVVVHEGTLEVTRFELAHPRGVTWIRGDLRVDGDLEDWEHAVLLVEGTVACRSARLRGAFACTGDLEARAYVYANSGNDRAFAVGGTLRTPVFVEEGTASWAARIEAEVWRRMNAVVIGEGQDRREVPRTEPAQMTHARLAELGLDAETALELAELLALSTAE